MKIPVVVVDDQEVDRYLIRRRLARTDDFELLDELPSGDRFLQQYFMADRSGRDGPATLLVLMDINMPGLDGFQTIDAAQKLISDGQGPDNLVVLIFTSSDSAQDRERAEEFPLVKGYISKPVDNEGISRIREIYLSIS
ncbi:MAG: response regulator [Granulosicoccus sp.]|nr:response regulator [Granulosicoccus sp.]